jgi:hypothetical protein
MIITRKDLEKYSNCDFYDGSLIHSRFVYKFFRDKVIPIGNIVAFRAPMEVTGNLIDLEDSLEKDYIYSNDAVNFCFEIPGISNWAGVAFQRLYATIVGNILAVITELPVEVEGDDIFVRYKTPEGEAKSGKASVSIVCEKNGAVLGHLGINIDAGSKAPDFAYSTKMADEQIDLFMKECIKAFYITSNSIFIATTKIIS